jgi:hypothetical protein
LVGEADAEHQVAADGGLATRRWREAYGDDVREAEDGRARDRANDVHRRAEGQLCRAAGVRAEGAVGGGC